MRCNLDEQKTQRLAEVLTVSKCFSGCVFQVGDLSAELKELPMRSLLASAFITYLPSAPEDVRQDKVKNWMEITGRVLPLTRPTLSAGDVAGTAAGVCNV